MPPETSRATRRPRSSSGTGVGSSGTSGLSLRRPRVADQVQDLARRPLDVVVGDHVVVVGGLGHLALSDPAARGKVFGRLAPPLLLALPQLPLRGRDYKDRDRVGNEAEHLLGAL